MQTGLYREEGPNHVLLNAYSYGGGIYDHQDGPIYFPAACILSTGGPAVINFKRKLPEGLSLLCQNDPQAYLKQHALGRSACKPYFWKS